MSKTGLIPLLALLALPVAVHSQNVSYNATFAATDTPGLAHATGLINRSASAPPGRLFFSQARREALDQQRKTLQFQETVVEGDSLSLDGIVTRSSGRWTVWINGNPVTERESGGMVSAPARDGRARLQTVNTGESPVVIAVGESVERASGEHSSPLGSGSIRVHSRVARR